MPLNLPLQREAAIHLWAGIPTAACPTPGSFDSDTVDSDMTLYARWSGTVSFDSNGGSIVQEQEVAEGGHAVEPSAPPTRRVAMFLWAGIPTAACPNAWNFDLRYGGRRYDAVRQVGNCFAQLSFNVNGGSAVPGATSDSPKGSHAAEPSCS